MRRTIALLSASLLVLTACSDKTPGAGSAASGSPSQAAPTTSPAPNADVPKVTNPIDVTGFLQKPCDAVTPEQINGWLGSGATTKPNLTSSLGPECDAFAASGQAAIGLSFDNPDKFSLSILYASKAQFPLFLSMQPIDGHPVTAYDKTDARMTRGDCSVAVGVSDQRSISVSVTLSQANVGKKDPCDTAHEAAATVLGNLKAVN